MKYFVGYIAFLFFCFSTNGQNLITNGDFELRDEQSKPAYWRVGALTPDYYEYPTFLNEINIDIDLQKINSSSFIGDAFGEKWSEFFFTKLNKSLNIDSSYVLSFNLLRGNHCKKGIDTLFLLLDSDSVFNSNSLKLNIPLNGNSHRNWEKVEHQFIADRTVNYLAMGNFKKFTANNNSKKQDIILTDLSSFGCIYLYFDNIYLSKYTTNPIKKKEEMRISFFFDIGKYDLQAEGLTLIQNLTDSLQNQSNTVIHLIGYADDVGDTASNYRLSRLRSIAVKKALLNIGLEEKNIFTKGGGEIKPLGDGAIEDIRKGNRRVDVVFKNLKE